MTAVFKRVRGADHGVSAALRDGLRQMADAVGCRSAHGFVLGQDGRLRMRASVPVTGAASSGIGPEDARDLFEAMYGGCAVRLDPEVCAAAVPHHAVTAVEWVAAPLVAGDDPIGVALAELHAAADERTVACIEAFGRAIGARVSAERAAEVLSRRLRASERTAERLVVGVLASVSAFILDLDARVLRWGPAAARRFGWREDDVRGARLPLAEGSEARVVRELRDGAAGGEPSFAMTFDIRCRDGSLERVSATAVAVAGAEEDATAVLVVCRDQNRAQDEAPLRQSYLAALVERELASPLTAIKGYAELLSRPAISEDSAQRARVARALADRAQEIEHILDDLALLSGLERSGGLIAEAVELSEVVEAAAQRVNARHGTDVLLIEPRAVGGRVLVDRRCAERSLEGLFRCVARVAGRAQGVRVSLRAEERTVGVVVEVCEASDETVPARPETGHALTEAGVGFHLARLAAEAHGGAVRIEPSGTAVPSVEVWFPLHDGDEEAAWLVPMM
ncbi:MAG: PAS domain-containing protein [Coriobacteriia bacterium]|nr:PAS domain-containing protein [Coriobacteriia bacterium]